MKINQLNLFTWTVIWGGAIIWNIYFMNLGALTPEKVKSIILFLIIGMLLNLISAIKFFGYFAGYNLWPIRPSPSPCESGKAGEKK